MKTDFEKIATNAVKDLYVINEKTMQECKCSFVDCFPAYLCRTINVDGKDYGLTMEIKIREI